MQLSPQQIKLSIGRGLLRLMPLILMGTITLATFWLVQKNTPPEKSALERARLHEPDYTIKDGALSALNELGNTKYRILGVKVTHYDDDASIDILTPRMRLFQAEKAQLPSSRIPDISMVISPFWIYTITLLSSDPLKKQLLRRRLL